MNDTIASIILKRDKTIDASGAVLKGEYRLAVIPEIVLRTACKRVGSRIGLKEGERLPMRAVLHEINIQAAPDVDIYQAYPLSCVVAAWRV